MTPRNTPSPNASGPSLAELIQASRTDLGLSFEGLAARTQGTVSGSRWHQLVTRPSKNPLETETVRAVCNALGLSHHAVWDAVGRSVGLDIPDDDPQIRVLPPERAHLTPADWRLVCGFIRQLADARVQGQHAGGAPEDT